MAILTVSVWHLAQKLKIQQIEDIGGTMSVIVTFHLPIHDGASREPPPVVHDALILDFISSWARQ
jgi:hypothetical protein